MKVIGLTGGIGSGKSVVAELLKVKYGACILDTDGIAKNQMEPGGASYKLVVDYFGKKILSSDGAIDRQKLAAIIFEDKSKRLKINELTHPIVLEAVKREVESKRKEGNTEYLIVETALMMEARYDFICDEVWYVYAAEEVRRSWLKASRNYTDEKIDLIMANQSKEEAFRAKYTKVIENIGDKQCLEMQIDNLLLLV